MHPTTKTFINTQRFARFTKWAGLWLQAFAAILLTLSAFDADEAYLALHALARGIAKLITLRAANNIKWQRRGARAFGKLRRASLTRTLIGSALRRRLRGYGIIALFFALLRVMRDLDAFVARQARRLAKGLTRICPRLPKREHGHAVIQATVLEIAPADSS